MVDLPYVQIDVAEKGLRLETDSSRNNMSRKLFAGKQSSINKPTTSLWFMLFNYEENQFMKYEFTQKRIMALRALHVKNVAWSS